MLREEVVTVDNPYQPPSAEEEPLLPVAALKDPRVLALVSLWLYAVATVVEVGDHLYRLLRSTELHDTYYVIVSGVGSLDVLMILSSLASSVVYLFWKYRAARNAIILDPARMRVSPAMAVGSYFIPLANFVIPYKAMRGISWATLGSVQGVDLWWAGHLGSLILGIAAALVSNPMVDRLTMFDHIYMVVSVATFFVSWWLVMRITRAQSAKCVA